MGKVVSIRDYLDGRLEPGVFTRGEQVILDLRCFKGGGLIILHPETARQWGKELIRASLKAENSIDRISSVDATDQVSEAEAPVEEGGPSGTS